VVVVVGGGGAGGGGGSSNVAPLLGTCFLQDINGAEKRAQGQVTLSIVKQTNENYKF
jgi:hypothetical protein